MVFFLFSASVTKLRLTFGQKSQEKKRQAIRLTSKDAKTRPTTKISYCFRLGFCVSNFPSIISNFFLCEKLTPNKMSQKFSNCNSNLALGIFDKQGVLGNFIIQELKLCSFSGWGQFLQSFCRSTSEFVISRVAKP